MAECIVHDCQNQGYGHVTIGEFDNTLVVPMAKIRIGINFCPFCGSNFKEEAGTKTVMMDHYQHAILVAKLVQAQIKRMRTDLLLMELTSLYEEHWKLKGYYEDGPGDETTIYRALKRVFSLNECLSDASEHIRRIVHALRIVKGSMDILEEEDEKRDILMALKGDMDEESRSDS